MRAKIIAPAGFRIAPEGHTVISFKDGDIVDGMIAEIAIQSGYAQRIDETAETLEWKTAIVPEPPEAPKFTRPRGRPRKAS
jgi:DNA-binding beta-propeller fold protein YncE